MIKRLLKLNDGFSLVEMIIVIAIILVLSLLSYTVIHSARAKDAAVKFGSEANAVKTMCMNMMPEDKNYDYFALAIYNDNNGTTHLCKVMHKVGTSNVYDYIDDDDVNLTSSVDVDFEGSSVKCNSSALAVATSGKEVPGEKSPSDSSAKSPFYICFDKRGNCYSGYGTYYFYKNNGNQVARVKVMQNGSIDVR